MRLNKLSSATATRHALVVEIADTPATLIEVFRLRYQVYCLERKFEPARDGLERDEFDDSASHVLVRNRASGCPVGTVRLVPGWAAGCGDVRYPMQQAADLSRLRQLPAISTAEISRFAISKAFRTECDSSPILLRLSLMRGIVMLSGRLGLTHWCALMDPALLRLLQMTAIYFQPIGPLVEHHGVRQPSVGRIGTVLDRLHQDCPEIWKFVTADGTLWREERIAESVFEPTAYQAVRSIAQKTPAA